MNVRELNSSDVRCVPLARALFQLNMFGCMLCALDCVSIRVAPVPLFIYTTALLLFECKTRMKKKQVKIIIDAYKVIFLKLK